MTTRIRDKYRNHRRFAVLSRDKFRCRYCGRSAGEDGVRLEVDHVVPVCLGGSDDLSNLAACCKSCNGGKGATIGEPPTLKDPQTNPPATEIAALWTADDMRETFVTLMGRAERVMRERARDNARAESESCTSRVAAQCWSVVDRMLAEWPADRLVAAIRVCVRKEREAREGKDRAAREGSVAHREASDGHPPDDGLIHALSLQRPGRCAFCEGSLPRGGGRGRPNTVTCGGRDCLRAMERARSRDYHAPLAGAVLRAMRMATKLDAGAE